MCQCEKCNKEGDDVFTIDNPIPNSQNDQLTICVECYNSYLNK